VNASGSNGLVLKLWHTFHRRINEKIQRLGGAAQILGLLVGLSVQNLIYYVISKTLRSPGISCTRKHDSALSGVESVSIMR